MELLIPGLILVALMVWASTKIKKRAADAFEAEFVETETFSLQKPEGFLHVIGDPEHEFYAYSKEFGENDNLGFRRATIEIDFFRDKDLAGVRDSILNSATRSEIRTQTVNVCELETEESANEIAIRGFYKLVAAENAVYGLRFAVLVEHSDEYLRKIDETLDSFVLKTL